MSIKFPAMGIVSLVFHPPNTQFYINIYTYIKILLSFSEIRKLSYRIFVPQVRVNNLHIFLIFQQIPFNVSTTTFVSIK